ncbi:MAG: LppX_LprAFG lipoprotein [Acidimicrobiales bacterium]|nr:LppX_LprAFG lipoprotein [Acidimicrobiales bacterium]
MRTLRPNRLLTLAFGLLLPLVVTACSSATNEAGDATIEEILSRSSSAMAKVETARFAIEQTGAAVYIDQAEQIQFSGATARFAAPSSADALIGVTAFGLSTEVGAVAIDGEIWITNPLTGKWEAAPEGLSFDPTVLFAVDTGWAAVLSGGLQAPVLVTEEGDTDERHHVRSTVEANRVSTLTGGLVNESSTLDLWIDAETGLVDEASFDVETGGGLTSWRLTVTNYDSDITITKPDLS